MEKFYFEQVVIPAIRSAGWRMAEGIQLAEIFCGSPIRSGMTQNDKEAGFTLLELLLTVAVFTILMLSSTVFYSRFINQNATLVAVTELSSDLQKAQMYAMMGRNYTGSNGGWGVNVTTSKITLYQGSSFTTRSSGLDESFDINSNLTVIGGTDINFAHFTGLPSTTAAVSFTGNNTTKTVTVNSQGVVSHD